MTLLATDCHRVLRAAPLGLFSLLCACAAVRDGATAAESRYPAVVRLVPGMPLTQPDVVEWRVLVAVRAEGAALPTVTPRVQTQGAEVVSLRPETAALDPARVTAFFLHLRARGKGGAPSITVSLKEAPECSATCKLPLGIDLSALQWESWFEGKDVRSPSVRATPTGEREWKPIRLPKLWEEEGLTWVRTRFVVPAAGKAETLRVRLRAVDDGDVTFVNGHEIGRTMSWDAQRDYPVPPDAVRWGEENELCIAVDNPNAGGGVYRVPLLLTVGDTLPAASVFPEAAMQEESERARPTPLGARLPFRKLVVREGVLRYADGGEVALWGVNYYPQSWTQYGSLKKLGIDHRRSLDEDFADFAQMGLDIIRIHVFDTEISAGDGNLIRNEHLDLLDYLVAQCDKRGICLMLTPMAWWWSPSARPDSFSQNTPKQAMSMWEQSWEAQRNYLRQLLTHKNPYTKRRLVDEPCLVLFEVINEPTYWSYGDVTTGTPGETRLNDELSTRAMEGVRKKWHAFVPDETWQAPHVFAYFRYDLVRRYVNAMIDAMRATGAAQPIAYSSFGMADVDLAQAVADSNCDAITMSAYPGGLRDLTDGENLLSQLGNAPYDSRFAAKARLVYEFDAPGTIRRVGMYPALARHWRNLGVQVACQFQYDARAIANFNPDWAIHYLNLWHTPEKAASFLIGGEVFRRLPRGAEFSTPEDDQLFPPGAVSFQRNAALLCADDCYMQARPTDWQPLPLPKSPRHLVSVGTCPYFEYEGTGVADLRIDDGAAELRLLPDVERRKYGLSGTPEDPLTVLHENEHPFR
ncbi:MAG: hypothetical protein GW802_34980, partial [Armatimonadetes bacterium]|nr:hypothetical protein [Armatimonadota bacterium]